jgi:hypothetical protein
VTGVAVREAGEVDRRAHNPVGNSETTENSAEMSQDCARSILHRAHAAFALYRLLVALITPRDVQYVHYLFDHVYDVSRLECLGCRRSEG